MLANWETETSLLYLTNVRCSKIKKKKTCLKECQIRITVQTHIVKLCENKVKNVTFSEVRPGKVASTHTRIFRSHPEITLNNISLQSKIFLKSLLANKNMDFFEIHNLFTQDIHDRL